MLPAVLALLLTGCVLASAAAPGQGGKESDVRCGAEWVTLQLPGVPAAERDRPSAPVANHRRGAVPTIRKGGVRNAVSYPDTQSGEIVFRLRTGNKDRPTVICSGLVTERACLDVVM